MAPKLKHVRCFPQLNNPPAILNSGGKMQMRHFGDRMTNCIIHSPFRYFTAVEVGNGILAVKAA